MKKMIKKAGSFFSFLAFVVFLSLQSGVLFAQNGQDRPSSLFQPQLDPYGGLGFSADPIPGIKGLREGVLPNGLRYYILENSTPKDRAYLTLAVNAGSILENEDERGLAHFVEHMAFNGTRRFPEADLINYLRSLGMRFGPEVNAYTAYDRTVYGIEAPTETDEDGVKRIPEKALAILDDWTWALTFSSKDVDDERAVIMEEYRSRLGAQFRVQEKMLAAIFRGSRYAERMIIGLPETIRNAPAEKLEAFYKRWYVPANMALILAGDFDGAALEKELASHFTAPKPFREEARPWYELPGPVPGRVAVEVVADGELPYATLYLYYKRSYEDQRKDLYSLRQGVIDFLISSMIEVRNEDAASFEETPFIGAGNWESRHGRLSRYFVLAAQAKSGKTSETLESLLLEKESLVRYGFTQSELDQAKASLLSYLEYQVSEKDKRESVSFVDDLAEEFLEGAKTVDLEWQLDAVRRMLPAINLETVKSAVTSYFENDDLLVLVTVPEQEENVPGEGEIRRMIEEAREAEIAPPLEIEQKNSLVDEALPAGSIVNEAADPSGALIWTLGNGARVILKETANRNSALSFYALALGGETSVSLDDDISAYNAAEIEAASGLGPFTRPEISAWLSNKQLSLSFWTNPYTRGFSGETSLSDIENFFQLLYLHFTAPRVDESAVNLVREARRTRLIQEKDNPETVFAQELTRFVYSGHPRFKPVELSDLDRMNGAAALAFLKKSLNPSDYLFVFSGSLGPRQGENGETFPLMRGLVETWLASIPGTGGVDYPAPWNAWEDPEVQRPLGLEKTIRKGREQKCLVYMAWFKPLDWDERANASVLVLNEYLDIVLTDDIREKLGGVYSVSAQVSLTPAPKGELTLNVFFICDPERSGELRTAVKEKLTGLVSGSDDSGTDSPGAIDEETLERAKKALVMNFALSMENNAFIARNYANFDRILKTPLSHLDERPSLYNSVTAEEIRALLTRLFADAPAELLLLPE